MLADLSIPPWLLGLGGVFTVITALGGSFVVLRASIASKTTELWKQQAEAFEERVEQVEKENGLLKVANNECKVENEGLKGRVSTLEQVVGAGPAIEALRRDLATQHTEMIGLMQKNLGVKERRGTAAR